MKVSYGGRVRKVNVVPSTMSEFRRVVQQKFINCQLIAPDEQESMAMSRILDDSELHGNVDFAKNIDQSVKQRDEESKIRGKGKKPKREKNTVDFQNSVCFYEDSEGDFNVISEDEDLSDATTYVTQHNQKALKCTIVPKTYFEDIRNEQQQSDLNQSMNWQSSILNQYHPAAKKERKVKKQKTKNNDEMPAAMRKKVEEFVRQLENEKLNASRAQMENEQAPAFNQSVGPNSAGYDESMYVANQPKMAVLVSADFINIEVQEGKEISLEFTVQNQSEMAWPFKPFVQNEKDKSIKQHVDVQLQPGEKTIIRYIFRAPLQQDSPTVSMLLQLVEPREYAKFCNDTIVVVCKVTRPDESMFELGFSLNGDEVPQRHTEFAFGNQESMIQGESDKMHDALLAKINNGLEQFGASDMYDEQSMDDARSMVESLEQRPTDNEDDDIINQTRALLANLMSDAEQMDADAQEEAKKDDVKHRMANLGKMLDKADQIRQSGQQ